MKILIADDEDYTREGLVEEIDWEDFGIDEIMQAVNGEEALKIVKWFRPDIVLSDIRMPKIDGIAFAEEMVRLIPGSKLIFMSGYMETEYLKSAIRLSVIDYIEKPIDVVQVKKALRRAVDEIARERAEGKKDFLFLEAALLIEKGYLEIVDEMWYIYADEQVRRRRLKEKRGYSDEKITAIFRSQLKEEEYRRHCKLVINNSESLESACREIEERIRAI